MVNQFDRIWTVKILCFLLGRSLIWPKLPFIWDIKRYNFRSDTVIQVKSGFWMSKNSEKASVLVSDKKPAFFEKSRLKIQKNGFYIFIVGHGQNMPKVPKNCIWATPCPKNSTSILYLYIVCDTLNRGLTVTTGWTWRSGSVIGFILSKTASIRETTICIFLLFVRLFDEKKEKIIAKAYILL